MNQQLAEHNRRLELQRDLEDAFQRLVDGKADEDDKRLVAWGLGIANFHGAQQEHEHAAY